jgi:hypothetical protein
LIAASTPLASRRRHWQVTGDVELAMVLVSLSGTGIFLRSVSVDQPFIGAISTFRQTDDLSLYETNSALSKGHPLESYLLLPCPEDVPITTSVDSSSNYPLVMVPLSCPSQLAEFGLWGMVLI